MLRLLLAIVSIGLPSQLCAHSPPHEVRANVAGAQMLGAASYRWLGLPLYDATLYTTDGMSFDWSRKVALQLVYARKLSRDTLVNATLAELVRMERSRQDHPAIRKKLTACMRGTTTGDRIVAISTGRDSMSFWFNGWKTCDLSHPGIKRRVLGIWLSEGTRFARQSRALKGW